MSDAPEETGTGSSEPSAQTPQIRWQFIDASSNSRSNLTRVKRHVMQEYMRQKRHGSSQSGNENEEPVKKSEKPPATARRRRPKNQSAEKNSTTGKAKKRRNTNRKEKGSDALNEQDDLPAADLPAGNEESALPGKRGTDLSLSPKNITLQLRTVPSISPSRDSYASGEQSCNSESDALTSWSSAPTTPYELALSPRSALSAARTDPFNVLPMDMDAEGHKLFDFYVNEMPACSYGTHFRSRKAHNWYTAVFVPEGMKGAVTFQNTILVHAANTWAWVRNESESKMGLIHRNRAISMLREHFADNPGDISDVAIIACLSAAGLEDFDPRPGHKQTSWVHMRAAREMIRARGGPAAFENTRLGMLINWQDYVLSGYETHGLSFFFEPTPPIQPCPPLALSTSSAADRPQPSSQHLSTDFEGISSTSPPLSPQDELRHQCEEFIVFLHRCEQLSHHQNAHFNTAIAPIRCTAFQRYSLLHQILSAPPGARFTTTGNRKQFVARLVCLIMLNAGLWDYRLSVAHSEVFLRTLENAVLESEVNTSGSVEALLQIMLECNDGPVEPGHASAAPAPDFTQYSADARTPAGRPWFVGRMLKVAKRVEYTTWMRLTEFLLGCLMLRAVEGSVAAWEEELRREILSAPLTSYVMPALRG